MNNVEKIRIYENTLQVMAGQDECPPKMVNILASMALQEAKK